MFGEITELQINRDVKVVASVDGLVVSLEFLISGGTRILAPLNSVVPRPSG